MSAQVEVCTETGETQKLFSSESAISEWHDTDEVIDDALNRLEDVMNLV